MPEAAAYFGMPCKHPLGEWERLYYKEGAHALYKENRGRKRDMKLDKSSNLINTPKETEEDLIIEVQRLRAENAYLKKLRALVQERIAQENGKEQEPSKN